MSNVVALEAKRPEPPAPPASIDAEQALLGAVILNPDAFAIAASFVREADFSAEIHRRIFDVMGGLLRSGRAITIEGLLEFLGDHDVGAGVSTKGYLARLAANATTIIGAPDYARIIRDTSVRRGIIEAARQLESAAFDARVDLDPIDVASSGLEKLRGLLEQAPRGRSRFHLGAGMEQFVERMERIRRGDEKTQGMTTGFLDLDRAIGGLQPGTVVVVAARVAMGKTVVMTNLAHNIAACNEGIGVLEFSLEIPPDQLQARHLAQVVFDSRAPVTFPSILAGQIDDRDAERVILAQRDFMRLPIIVECPPKVTAAEIAARIHVEKKALAARGIVLGTVLIDYLDKIEASDRYAGQRTYEIQEIITILKSAAMAENVCVVLLCQLNRATEGREDKRPSLADLKSSSFIEQEAHAIIFVYREAYYLLKSAAFREQEPEALVRLDKVRNAVELIIGKNRGGPETTIHLWGDVACSYLSSLDGRMGA